MKRILTILTMFAFLVLTACTGAGNGISLSGSAWKLVGLNGSAPLEGTTLTLTFDKNTLGGNAGCNSFGGKYEVDGDILSITELVSTLMACADTEVMDQESAYLNALGAAQTFSVKGTELRILSADRVELVFSRQE